MSMPAHVVEITPEYLRLGGELKPKLAALRAGSYAERLFRDPQLRLCLRRASPDNPLADPDLAAMLDWLAAEGWVFMEQLYQPYGPAELMRALQAAGEVRRDFSALVLRTPDDWELSAHPLG